MRLQRMPAAWKASRVSRREAFRGRRAVNGNREVRPLGDQVCEALPFCIAEGRVMEEQRASPCLVKDLRFACLRDGQAASAVLELEKADFGRFVRLRVRPQ